jgi:hypothetical protein
LGISIQLHEVNGQPGAVLLDPQQRIINVFSLDIADGVVQTIRGRFEQPLRARRARGVATASRS